MMPASSRSALFPYTTLFRSLLVNGVEDVAEAGDLLHLFVNHRLVLLDLFEIVVDGLHPPRRVLRHLLELRGVVRRVVHRPLRDRKSTRLNSSHANTSYAVFC